MSIFDNVSTDASMQPFIEMVNQIIEMDDAALTPQAVESLAGAISGALTPAIREKSVQEIVKSFNDEGLTKKEAKESVEAMKKDFLSAFQALNLSENKKQALDSVFSPLIELFDTALVRYHIHDIELPIMLEDGAQMPTYAHESDACADIYALDDTIVPAHSQSNKIRTGLHFAIPENWQVGILPRSSIGSKTGLRLSNSRGVIDEQYRDEIMVLYDNISDSDYTIKAGDRIAQMFVQPVYRFKGVPVTKEAFDAIEGNRGGGFGSTGK